MADFATTIKRLRMDRGITQEQLASMLKVSRSTIGMYETGSREPDFETCEAIADIFNVDMDYLLGRSNVERKAPLTPTIPPGFLPLPETERLPLVGQIACGTPILAEENIQDYVDVPKAAHATFVLLCKGDSMAPRIQDGDLVYVRKQPMVENGELAAVRVEEEATLKRVYISPSQIILQAENPAYPPFVYSGPDLNTITIEGKIVGIYRDLESSANL